MTVNYFAYGSNLLFARLYARTPSIVNLGVVALNGYRLTFDKPGSDGSGKCGIEKVSDNDQVLGVLYQMAVSEKPILDQIEGEGFGYLAKDVQVTSGDDVISAFTYFPTQLGYRQPPYDWYKAFVLEGARENHFPEDYIAMIENVECIVDQDEERRSKNQQILPSSL